MTGKERINSLPEGLFEALWEMRADHRGDDEDFVFTTQKGGQLNFGVMGQHGTPSAHPNRARNGWGGKAFRNNDIRHPVAAHARSEQSGLNHARL
jgi:hypothetical protein